MSDNTTSEVNKISEHDAVVLHICDSSIMLRYTVKNNIGNERFFVGNLFPDILVYQKDSDTLVFIMEIRRNGDIAQCIQQWKTLPSIPATLYIVVPEADLANAKSIAQVVGLRTKFGSYIIDAEQKISVKYE